MFEEQIKLIRWRVCVCVCVLIKHFGFHKNDHLAHPAFPINVSMKFVFIDALLNWANKDRFTY